MFAVKCDLCGETQTEDDASKLTGTAISMNGVTRHACGSCMGVLRAAFAVGKEGLLDPLKALAKVTEERDRLFRLTQAHEQARQGNVLSLEEISQSQRRYGVLNPAEANAPRLEGPAAPGRTEMTKPMSGRLLGGKKPDKKRGRN